MLLFLTKLSVNMKIKRLFWKTEVHEFKDENGTFSANIVDVLTDGHLVLDDTEGRRRTYAFKEVQFVI